MCEDQKVVWRCCGVTRGGVGNARRHGPGNEGANQIMENFGMSRGSLALPRRQWKSILAVWCNGIR